MHWVVDAIEEGQAAIEVDGRSLLHLPLAMLPAGLREGERLTVLSVADPQGVTWQIRRDPASPPVGGSLGAGGRSPGDPGGHIYL